MKGVIKMQRGETSKSVRKTVIRLHWEHKTQSQYHTKHFKE